MLSIDKCLFSDLDIDYSIPSIVKKFIFIFIFSVKHFGPNDQVSVAHIRMAAVSLHVIIQLRMCWSGAQSVSFSGYYCSQLRSSQEEGTSIRTRWCC